MTVTGISVRITMFSKTIDHTFEAEIPLEGSDLVLTETVRESFETRIRKCALSDDTVREFKDLIAKYGIAGWAGKTPSARKICDDDGMHESTFLTLRFDDGSSAGITFREVPEETGCEAAAAFRKLFFSARGDDKLISKELIYPNLKECREIKEEHGPVVAVETGFFSSGMMMNSNEWYTQLIEKAEGKEGTVLVTVKRKRGNGPEAASSKEISSDILSKVQEISVKENIPAWHYACKDPSIPVDTSMIPTDYTSNGWLNIYYDDSLVTGCPRIKRTIGETACKMGGKETDSIISKMINDCVRESGVKAELPEVNPFANPNMPVTADPSSMNGFISMGMMMGAGAGFGAVQIPSADQNGAWDCTCGEKGITGKFCSNCGMKRP